MVLVERFLYGYLQGYLETARKLAVPDFVLLSESNGIISGYVDGEFFEQIHGDEFEAEKKVFNKLIRFPTV